ncbi:MAG TPA: lytic transglycosylase domain-containing protein [Solirubrobacterales bacterium]|nr:lytic transglycosylase domain-containing protein [Solirubrobacterales bacterium]
MAGAPRAYVEAAERWGYLAEGQAHKYGVANGATLLLKIASGESSFNMKAVSSAGARGATQFIPTTRQSYISQYGVDPWKSPDEAIHATALFLKHQGLAAYNPGGGQGYIDYILGQPVGAKGGARTAPSPSSQQPSASSSSPEGAQGALRHIGLVATLVLGGAALIGLGVTRVFGSARGQVA